MMIAEYIKQLNWRYATKQFDTTKKLSAEQLQFVKDVLRLSPSSTGLQPWKFVIVTDTATRAALLPKAYGQAQITDAAALVVMCRLNDVNEAHVDKVITSTAAVRKQEVSELQGYREMMLGLLKSKDAAALMEWSSDQVYIALGMLISACAAVEIDACPMEGFDRAGFDQILGLDKEGCTSYAVCALGFRSPEDKYAHAAKARLSESDLIIER